MVELKLTDGEHTFFITISEYATVQDLIDELKKRITLIRPTLLCKGEPLSPGAIISRKEETDNETKNKIKIKNNKKSIIIVDIKKKGKKFAK